MFLKMEQRIKTQTAYTIATNCLTIVKRDLQDIISKTILTSKSSIYYRMACTHSIYFKEIFLNLPSHSGDSQKIKATNTIADRLLVTLQWLYRIAMETRSTDTFSDFKMIQKSHLKVISRIKYLSKSIWKENTLKDTMVEGKNNSSISNSSGKTKCNNNFKKSRSISCLLGLQNYYF